jgi:hypothetical protein
MLQTQNETVLNAILDKGEEALVGVLFMLHDEESVERCSHEMVGSEEEWPTYTYKASTNQGSAKLAKTFTPWWSLLTHLKDKVWQSAKEKTTVFEQTMSLATGLEMLTELTPQHEEVRKMLTYIDPPYPQPKPPCAAILTRFVSTLQLLKIPHLQVPKKSKTSYELFCNAANISKARKQLETEGYNILESYNNIPAQGYHREASVRQVRLGWKGKETSESKSK